MGLLSKNKVPVAASHHAKLDVSVTHVTTGEFMQAQVAAYRHMLPKEHLRGSAFVNARLAPMAVPTYGRCRINLRHFFVPFVQVFPNIYEFLTSAVANNYEQSSLVEMSPHFYNQTVAELFITGYNGEDLLVSVPTAGEGEEQAPYDLVDYIGRFYRFTTIGREMYHTFLSLGYRFVLDDKTQSATPISALALLSYAKVFCDYYFNQNYLDSYEYTTLQKLFKFNDPTSALELTVADLYYLLRLTRFVSYDGVNEYITNAWDTPMSPAPGNELSHSITDYTSGSGATVINMNNDLDTPMMVGNALSNIGTQYSHWALNAMTDYIKRHQLSSASAVQRFLAEYGVQLDKGASQKSIYIGMHTQDVNFDAVYSTADTGAGDNPNLGDYAGRGMSQGNTDIDFTADEFGLFISISSIVPMGGYVQGLDRNNLHVMPTDFFVNEYDNMIQAISKAEVYMSTNAQFGDFDDYMSPFGYCPKYAEMKVGRTMVTGDFVLPARFAGGEAWNLFRLFDDSSFEGDIDNLHHSLNFTRGIDYPQYNRIFQDTNTTNDKFYLVYHFALSSDAPCKSLFDSYDFSQNGKMLVVDSGPKVN